MRQKLFNVFLVCLFCLTVPAVAFAQQAIKVTGKVIDSTNEGVPGVNVSVKGGSLGTITDIDGNYKIDVPNSKSVLVFSFIGYAKQEIPVGNKTVINVTMKDDTQLLDEVVVVAYGTSRKGDLTGAITSVRPDENEASKAISIDNLLQGKVAGLSMSVSSSTPGAANSITIRGANSLRGDNQPLYVIDNVPQASTGEFAQSAMGGGDFQIAQDPLSSLNPSDIEDITVLKDASATAIYGSRGANGVILITTKKGKEGKARINVSANFTTADAANLHKMMDLRSYGMYKNSQVEEASRLFYFVGDEIRYVTNDKVAGYDPNDPTTYSLPDYVNWQKELYRSAFSQNYSASVSGGANGMRYYFSAGFKNIEGIARNTGIKQGDFRGNINVDLSKTVTLAVNLSGSLKENNMMGGGDTKGGPTGSAARTAIDTQPFRKPSDDPTLQDAENTDVDSWVTDYTDLAHDKTFRGSLDLGWKITKFLRYNLRTGGNIMINDRGRWYGLALFKGRNEQGVLALTDWNRSNYNVENVFNLNTNLGKIAKLDATLGITYDVYKDLTKNIYATNFTNFDFGVDGLHMAGQKDYKQPIQKDYQLLSYLGRVNLSFYDKYLVTASLRVDGSSKFQKGKRFAYFPSASIAWRMEQEEFMKDINWLSQLKLRVSYGETGSQSITPYSTFSDYARVMDYATANGEKELAAVVSKLQNDGLKWERTSSWNAGFDFGVLKQRITGSFEYYKKKTSDLLINRDLPLSSGFASVTMNQGSLTNEGVEFSLDATIIDNKEFQWSLGGNIGYNKTKITELGLPESVFSDNVKGRGYLGNTLGSHFGVANIFLEGKAPGLFYGYQTDGIVQESDLTDGSYKITKDINGGVPQAGDIKFIDQNGDGEINEADKMILGDPNRPMTYGFQTKLTYKGLSLSAAFTGVSGYDVLNTNVRYEQTPSRQTSNLYQKVYNGMWTAENPTNLYPRSTYKMPDVVMDRYIEDASYLRCSDITLNYVLPNKWMKKIGFRTTSIFASVKNAFVITDYSGYDPEVNSFAFDGLRPGIDMSSFPNMRSFIFGINVNF